ncbi:MAG TPA: helix-turn-helix transcriptional regulator [Chryseosolibacter sp.]
MKSQEGLDKRELGKLLGARVRFLREKKGISLREFETYEGAIDRQALAKIEKGLKIPTAFTLYRIARVIGVRVEEFFKDLD